MYVQAYQVQSMTMGCYCGPALDRVVEPLRRCGGKMYRDNLAPTNIDVQDPVIFEPIDKILDDPLTPSTVVESP